MTYHVVATTRYTVPKCDSSGPGPGESGRGLVLHPGLPGHAGGHVLVLLHLERREPELPRAGARAAGPNVLRTRYEPKWKLRQLVPCVAVRVIVEVPSPLPRKF